MVDSINNDFLFPAIIHSNILGKIVCEFLQKQFQREAKDALQVNMCAKPNFERLLGLAKFSLNIYHHQFMKSLYTKNNWVSQQYLI